MFLQTPERQQLMMLFEHLLNMMPDKAEAQLHDALAKFVDAETTLTSFDSTPGVCADIYWPTLIPLLYPEERQDVFTAIQKAIRARNEMDNILRRNCQHDKIPIGLLTKDLPVTPGANYPYEDLDTADPQIPAAVT